MSNILIDFKDIKTTKSETLMPKTLLSVEEEIYTNNYSRIRVASQKLKQGVIDSQHTRSAGKVSWKAGEKDI